MLIDTHCHLTYEGPAHASEAVLERAAAADVHRFITVGTHPADHLDTLALTRRFPHVFAALGIHPHHAPEVSADYLPLLEAQLRSSTKILAVGECGLDYHYPDTPKELQHTLFIQHLQLAQRLKLPLILHIREAHADALAILRDFSDLSFVVHCFTGTPEECQVWLDRGAYIGITGIVTYKNAADVQKAAVLIPTDKLLLETDSPYLSPEPVRKIKINEPANVAHVARFLAQLRHTPLDDLARDTTANAARLFGSRLLTGTRSS